MDRSTIKKALAKAKYHYNQGIRYYDVKHRTYNPASYSDNILQHVSDLLGLHGIESYTPDDNNPDWPDYSYVNTGDTYNLTLVYIKETCQFRITDIGTIIESNYNNEVNND